MKSLFTICLFIVLSCTSNKINDIQCTEEARAGLNITERCEQSGFKHWH
ncbi:MAG: hypothetical protein IBX66_00210 [Lutibacter sp.]|nr:hypothetical protein [Lutibacter sp.]